MENRLTKKTINGIKKIELEKALRSKELPLSEIKALMVDNKIQLDAKVERPKGKERINHLICQLELSIKETKVAHHELIIALKLAINDIEKKGVAFGMIQQEFGGAIKGQLHTAKILAYYIEPVLAKIFPNNSVISIYFDKYNLDFKFSKDLNDKESYDKTRSSINKIQKDYVRDSISGLVIRSDQDMDSLLLLDLVILALSGIAPSKKTERWCKFCFRKSLCVMHEILPYAKKGADYRNYDRGKKIYKIIPKLVRDLQKSHRDQRILLGEKFAVESESNSHNLNGKEKTIYLSHKLNSLVTKTIVQGEHEFWSDIAPLWQSYISSSFPNVDMLLNKKASNFLDWIAFTDYVKEALANLNETTTHPLWIIYMLIDAENWIRAEKFVNEGHVVDKRKSDNLSKILKIYPSETTSQTEIAKRLNLTRQAVSKALNAYLKSKFKDKLD